MDRDLMDALVAPLTKLRQDYSLMAEVAARLATQLDAIHPQLPSAARGLKPQAAEHPAERPPSDAFGDRAARPTQVDVEGADFENLLNLQEQLSNLERVLRVSVTRLEHGRATLLVEMAPDSGPEQPREAFASDDTPPEEPTVLCAWCGKLISAGSSAISHGLCPECAGPFVRQRQPAGEFERGTLVHSD